MLFSTRIFSRLKVGHIGKMVTGNNNTILLIQPEMDGKEAYRKNIQISFHPETVTG
jgi:hypothetical protein